MMPFLAACRHDATTASSHSACAAPKTRSARPASPPPVNNSTPNQTTRASSTATAPADTHGRRPHGTEGPRRQAPAGQATTPGTPGRRADHVRHRKAGTGMLGVRRNEHARHRPGYQDQTARHACRPQRQTGRDNTGTHHHERQRHHPPVGSTHRGERADRLGNGVERARLQAGGNAPPGNCQHRSRGRRHHSPPRHTLHGLPP